MNEGLVRKIHSPSVWWSGKFFHNWSLANCHGFSNSVLLKFWIWLKKSKTIFRNHCIFKYIYHLFKELVYADKESLRNDNHLFLCLWNALQKKKMGRQSFPKIRILGSPGYILTHRRVKMSAIFLTNHIFWTVPSTNGKKTV